MFGALLERAEELIQKARTIRTNDDDGEFVQMFIAGFLEHAAAEDWGVDSYSFICDACNAEFSQSELTEFFGEHWKAFGLFHCLFSGYNLGLLVSGKINAEEFTMYEMMVYPYRDGHHHEITAAFGD